MDTIPLLAAAFLLGVVCGLALDWAMRMVIDARIRRLRRHGG